MQIRFNEVLAPNRLVAKLTAVLADLEKLGLNEMTDVRIELRPGTVDHQTVIAYDKGDCPDITTIDVEPGGEFAQDFKWRPVQSKRAESHKLSTDTVTFSELVARNWTEVDICGPSSTLSSSDNPAVLVPRLLRMILGLITDDARVSDGGDDDAIAAADWPQPMLGDRSYWDATRDDDGFVAAFTLGLLDRSVDDITAKRYNAFRNFPAVWRMPLPGVPQESKDKLMGGLYEIVQSGLQAAAIITLKPLRFATPLMSSGAARSTKPAAKEMTLLEAIFESANRDEVIQTELDGYRRDKERVSLAKRPR